VTLISGVLNERVTPGHHGYGTNLTITSQGAVEPSGGGAAIYLEGTANVTNAGTVGGIGLTYGTVSNTGVLTGKVDVIEGTIINFSSGDFTFAAKSAGTEIMVTQSALCFCRGTRIATKRGTRLVEALRPGGLVRTLFGGLQPVRWVGQRTYQGRFIAGNHLALPVCIRAGALAEGVPTRDLHISSGHGIWVEGVLVPAWRLVNGVSITQAAAVEQAAYFHIELDTHELLMAHGTPTESFLDDGPFRNQFHNAADYRARYPDAPVHRVCMPLPRLKNGFGLARIQTRVNRRAGLMPAPATPPGTLRGYIDDPGHDGWVRGWAQDMANPEAPVALRIYAHGRYITRTLANGYRPDLRAACLGSGCHGFAARVPLACAGAGEIRRETDHALLPLAGSAVPHLRLA